MKTYKIAYIASNPPMNTNKKILYSLAINWLTPASLNYCPLLSVKTLSSLFIQQAQNLNKNDIINKIKKLFKDRYCQI